MTQYLFWSDRFSKLMKKNGRTGIVTYLDNKGKEVQGHFVSNTKDGKCSAWSDKKLVAEVTTFISGDNYERENNKIS
jgi:hypothetical protein